MPTSSESKRPATWASVHLDAIRGTAALVVFLSHARSLFIKSGLRDALTGGLDAYALPTGPVHEAPAFLRHFHFSDMLYGHESIGHLAVIAFFVLSGYFVGGSVYRTERKGTFSWSRYAFQRLTRLWVVLIPALLLSFALDHAGMHFFKGSTNIYAGLPGADIAPGLAARATTAVMVGNALFLQGIVTLPFGTNIPLWSLSFEFWFYALFPLLVVACMAARPGRLRLISAVLFLVLLAFCGWRIAGFFVIWLFGSIIAMIPLRMPKYLVGASTLASAALVAAAMLGSLRWHTKLIVSDIIVGIAFSVFMWVVLHYKSDSSAGIYRACAQRLSAMSYTLYLVHYPMLAFLCALIMPHWHPWPLSPNSVLKLFGICTCVFLFAWCIYFCFERNTGRVRKWFATLNQSST